jgi:hypothetical protein
VDEPSVYGAAAELEQQMALAVVLPEAAAQCQAFT